MPTQIDFANVPDDVLEEIRAGLHNATVALAEVTGDGPDIRSTPKGSGTCVRLGDRRFILTAAHVWGAIKNSDRILLGLSERSFSGEIPNEAVAPHEVWRESNDGWGPDLALLEIPEPHASSLAAKKLFIDLAKHKAQAQDRPPKVKGGLWVITGMVGEWSGENIPDEEAGRVNVRLELRAFFGGVRDAPERGGFDYLEMSADTTLVGVPSTFGGVSGGGLWEVGLKNSKAGGIEWDKQLRLQGVAYRQDPASEGEMIIRCHGPQSVFEKAWSEWGLPS